MKEMNKENENNSFLDTIVNFAIVIRADLETIKDIKEDFAQNPCVDIVYQKFSFNKLIIAEDGETDGNKDN